MSNPDHQSDVEASGDSTGWTLVRPSVGRLTEWRSSSGELTAFSTRPIDPAIVGANRMAELLTAMDLQGIVAGPVTDTRFPLSVGLTGLGSENDLLTALILPPAPDGPLVVRSACLETVGTLRNVDAPLWDWMIRASGQRLMRNEQWAPQANLQDLPRLTPARPGESRDWLLEHLKAFEPKQSSTKQVAATALRAGLFLWHDFLDESHALAQSIEGEGADRLGDYWHAILHRREPDYSNAKYWFRQISPHPLYRRLGPIVDTILSESPAPEAADWRKRLQPNLAWDPMAFVDLCQKCAANEESPLALTARKIQLAEIGLLLQMTAHQRDA